MFKNYWNHRITPFSMVIFIMSKLFQVRDSNFSYVLKVNILKKEVITYVKNVYKMESAMVVIGQYILLNK